MIQFIHFCLMCNILFFFVSDNIEDVAEHLVNLAKKQGSRDNISVVVIFLKDPKQIVRKLPGIFGWTTETGADMDNSNNATNNAFDMFDVFQKKNSEGFMDCAGAFKQNGTGNKSIT